MPETNHESCVLVVAPLGRDASLIEALLRGSDICCATFLNVEDASGEIAHHPGAALIGEEALAPAAVDHLVSALKRQPPWSDLPIIVLTRSSERKNTNQGRLRIHKLLGNVTLVERPLSAVTLLSIVRTALRARTHQYEIRDYLQERQRVELELRAAREHLESKVEQRTISLRLLSLRLMRSQDDQNRRIARALHDSLGQYLSAMSITLKFVRGKTEEEQQSLISGIEGMIQQCVTETRTLSHLLHPPLLDEVGLTSAVTWYIEGFAKRSGIEVTFTLPVLARLPSEIETMLFRVVQEGFTNIHRHSGSKSAEVRWNLHDASLTLIIKDQGRGMPPEVLARVRGSGEGLGVGMAGMRERVNELGGKIDVSSDSRGTTIVVQVPVP